MCTCMDGIAQLSTLLDDITLCCGKSWAWFNFIAGRPCIVLPCLCEDVIITNRNDENYKNVIQIFEIAIHHEHAVHICMHLYCHYTGHIGD